MEWIIFVKISNMLLRRSCISDKFIKCLHYYTTSSAIKMPKYNYTKNFNVNNELVKKDLNKGEWKDYYSILGVKYTATTNEIKKVYYDLAKQYHPDSTNNGLSAFGAKKFQDISEAYHILSDDNKRMEYDVYGKLRDVGSFLRSIAIKTKNYDTNTKFVKSNVKDPEHSTKSSRYDSFTDFNAPEQANITLTFLQAIRGTKRDLNVKATIKCDKCSGVSIKQKQGLIICKVCNATGKEFSNKAPYIVKGPCMYCKGRKYTPQNECEACNNTGLVTKHRKVSVNIPSGVDSGDVIRVLHPNGKQNINIKITVLKSKHFNRIGNDVLSEKYLTISEAILGGIFKVRGIYEDFDVNLPSGVESHTKIRMKGKGVKKKTEVGDHLILIKIKIPKFLTAKQRELIHAFARTERRLEDYNPNTTDMI